MVCWATTSSPIVGSSRNSTSGECNKAAINSIFIRSPNDSSRTGWPSKLAHAQHGGQLVASAVEPLRLDAVNLLVQAERLGGGQIPPELVFLAHHQGEPAAIGVFAPPRDVSPSPGPCRRWAKSRRKAVSEWWFCRRRWAQEGNELALLDLKIDAADGLDQPVLATEQPADCGCEPFPLLVHLVRLCQPFDFNDGHIEIIIGPAQSGGKGRAKG